MKLVVSTKRFGDKEILFDDEDWAFLKLYTWHVMWDKNNFYARANVVVEGKRKSPKMHRIVLGLSNVPKPHIDHINGNGLDNRKENLRVATIAQNTKNRKLSHRSTSGYRGVSLYTVGKQAGKYAVRIVADGKDYFGGYFDDPVLAAIKYNELAIKYHGDFANLNKIGDGTPIQNTGEVEIAKQPDKNRKKSTITGFYGVTRASSKRGKTKKIYTAGIFVGGKRIHLGYFEDTVAAAKVYDAAAKKYHGDKASLNFPNE